MEEVNYADFAHASYLSKQDKINKINAMPGWNIDWNLSNDEHSVFYNDREVVTSYRGTSTSSDVGTDALIWSHLGKMSPRVSDSLDHYEQVLNKYKGYKHTLASHSLGGALNNIVFDKYGDKIEHVHNYNPLIVPSFKSIFSPITTLLSNVGKGKITNHRVFGDPVSIFSPLEFPGETKYYIPKSFNTHTIMQFI